MGKLTEIEKYAQAPWVYCPSLHFEKLGRLKDSDLLSSINQQIKECLYSHSSGGKISKIWMHFERLVNSILSDLHTIVNDDTCTIVRIGTLNALQPKWLVLRKMYESVKNLGYSDFHIFADRIDLLKFYEGQAETLVKTALEHINWLFNNDQPAGLEGKEDISIEDETIETLYSALFRTYSFDENIENYKTFFASLKEFSFLLNDCAYTQTYYLTINTQSLYSNVKRFQQNEFGIYTSRHNVFLKDYDNVLKTLGRKEGVPNPEKSPLLREEAFSITMQKSYSEVYALYEANRGKLESMNDSRNYSDEGWIQAFFSNLFQTHYKGEERDADGKLTNVFIDKSGNTLVEGNTGWERWIDFLTVIAFVRDYEQKQQPTTSNGTKDAEAEPSIPNQIFIKNHNGKPIDVAMLRKLLYDSFVVNVRYKYDWYAPYKFFNDIRILNDTGLKSFAKQMNVWYKDLPDSHKCDAEALSDWNCGYTGETHHNLWDSDVFCDKRSGKKQAIKGFQRLLTHILALKEQFRIIPVIKNPDNGGVR